MPDRTGGDGSHAITAADTEPAERGRVPVERFRLHVIAGPDAGRAFTSAAERAVIGTHETCELALTDRTVSRFHCELAPAGDRGVRIRDLDSRNGTFVDGVRVVDGYLRSGAILAIGKTELRFDAGGDRLELPVSTRDRVGAAVGRSIAMRRAFAVLERAAASDATVLLEGETGTGKEVIAESIHRESARRDGPFVVVDCGAIPSDLLESELFGHTRGAFTGAAGARDGAFVAADGGTIFLDEIGELGAELQPALLRVLERRHVKPVGGDAYRPVDVRVVAATNRDLRAMVNRKELRADLYYRLAVVTVRLPPLRERREDLPLLVDHLLAAIGATGADAEALRTPELRAELERHAWPGNVRELRNYLERCVALRAQPPIAPPPDDAADALDVDVSRPLKAAREAWLRPFERRYAERLLEVHGGNVAAAARAAGVDRITFYRLLWRLGLR